MAFRNNNSSFYKYNLVDITNNSTFAAQKINPIKIDS